VRTQVLALTAVLLGMITVLLLILSGLSLLDIARGTEPDLESEWKVVWYSLPLILVSQVLSILAIFRLWDRLKSSVSTHDE